MHLDNPCQYRSVEVFAAKTWELLRRSAEYRRQADEYVKLCMRKGARARTRSHDFIATITEDCRFAGESMRWMIDELKIVGASIERSGGNGSAELKRRVNLVWRGASAKELSIPDLAWMGDPSLAPKERVRRERQLAKAGWLIVDKLQGIGGEVMTRGPSLDHWDGDQMDELKQLMEFWRRDSSPRRKIYDHSWRQLPAPLKRRFMSLWEGLLVNGYDRVATHGLEPTPRVVELSADVERLGVLPEDLLLAVSVDLLDFRRNFLLFAFPKGVIVSNRLINSTFKDWRKHIRAANAVNSANLTRLGTTKEWEVFLITEQLIQEGHGREKAVREAYHQIKLAENSGKLNWNKDGGKFLTYFTRINSELIGAVYPKLNLSLLLLGSANG